MFCDISVAIGDIVGFSVFGESAPLGVCRCMLTEQKCNNKLHSQVAVMTQ
jgi:hypothetical protein